MFKGPDLPTGLLHRANDILGISQKACRGIFFALVASRNREYRASGVSMRILRREKTSWRVVKTRKARTRHREA